LIVRLRQAAYDHDRNLRGLPMLAQLSQHFIARQLGEHEVEDHEVGLAFKGETQPFFAVRRSDHVISCMLQRALIRHAKKPAVFDDQYIHARLFPSTEKHRQTLEKLEHHLAARYACPKIATFLPGRGLLKKRQRWGGWGK